MTHFRSTHFDNNGVVACGLDKRGNTLKKTTHPFAVDCDRCKQSNSWKTESAKKKAMVARANKCLRDIGLDPDKNVCDMTTDEIALYRKLYRGHRHTKTCI